MMRKLLIVVLCGFVQRSACSRMRFEQAFQEPLFRHDPQMQVEPVYRREHFFPREPIPAEQILPQQSIMRNEPIYANEPLMAQPQPQQAIIPGEQFIQSEPMLRNEQFIQTEPVFRRESFLRREPILRREPFLRSEQLMRGGRIYQNPPVLSEGGIFRNEPNAYTVMVSRCPCQEGQNIAPSGPQDTFFEISQPIQPLQQQPIMANRIIFPKPIIKQQAYQPIVSFPRIQRFMRKGFKPLVENIQFSAPAVQSAPGPEFNPFNSEPVPFSNFQNQGQQPENTSEPNQNNPVTVRNVPQMANPLTLAQMSSIC